jgi:hypothetical protein
VTSACQTDATTAPAPRSIGVADPLTSEAWRIAADRPQQLAEVRESASRPGADNDERYGERPGVKQTPWQVTPLPISNANAPAVLTGWRISS